MSDTPRTITLRPIATGEFYRVGDYLRDGAGILWPITRREGGRLYTSEGSVSGTDDLYREANPIPEGYEVCDLADATKVLIGETWCDVDFSVGINLRLDGQLLDLRRYFSGLGVLAIRPIPEPEPLTGEAEVVGGSNRGKCAGIAALPVSAVGKRIRWEVIE